LIRAIQLLDFGPAQPWYFHFKDAGEVKYLELLHPSEKQLVIAGFPANPQRQLVIAGTLQRPIVAPRNSGYHLKRTCSKIA